MQDIKHEMQDTKLPIRYLIRKFLRKLHMQAKDGCGCKDTLGEWIINNQESFIKELKNYYGR